MTVMKIRLPAPTRTDRRSIRWRRLWPIGSVACLVLVGVVVLVGSNYSISPQDAFAVLTGQQSVGLAKIGVDTRLPRALIGLVAGMALAAAGALLQALTRNPLASPDIIGVSQGTVAAVLAFTAFGPALAPEAGRIVIAVVGTAGGFGTALVIMLVTRRVASARSMQLILIGIMTGGLLSAFSSLCLIFLNERAADILAHLNGSVDLKTWSDLVMVLAYVAPGLALLLIAIPRGNVLQLGDDVAVGLGQSRAKDRGVVLLAAAVLTAGAVNVVGPIGFVGLIGPHIARGIVGSDLRRLVPAAALGGGAMVLIADFAARNISLKWILGPDLGTGYLPVGVYLTLYGVPFMISLMWRRR